jgi:predicted MFS family arabinose efflux permease
VTEASAAKPPQAPPSPWGVFASPAFTIMLAASSLSSVGIAMFDTATAWLMTSLNPSPLTVSAVQVATMAPLFLLTIPAGALADVVDPRRLLIVAQAAVVLVGLAFAALVSGGFESPTLLLATTFLLGATGALAAPAWQIVTPLLAARDQLDSAIAFNNAAYNVSRAIGPAIGGFAISAASVVLPFWVYCVTNFAVLAALVWWRAPRKARESLPTERFLSAMGSGIRYARHNRDLDSTLIRALAFFPFASAYWALMPLIARERLGDNPEFYGSLMGVLGLGSLAGTFALEPLKVRLGPDWSAAAAILGTAIALALFAVAPNGYVLFLASFIAGVSWIVVMTTMFVSAQVALPDWVRGRGLAIFLTAYFGAMTLGSALWGGVADKKGLPIALLAAGVGAAANLALARRFRLETGAVLDLSPAMDWRAPAFTDKMRDDEGPILMTVEYRVQPAERAEFLSFLREIGRERMRDGAYAWNAFEDPNEPSRIIETCLVRSLLELKYRTERLTKADAIVEERAASFLETPATVRYLVAPKRMHHRWRGEADA